MRCPHSLEEETGLQRGSTTPAPWKNTALWQIILLVFRRDCRPFLKHCQSELNSPSCCVALPMCLLSPLITVPSLWHNYIPFKSSLFSPSLLILTLICSLNLCSASFKVSSSFHFQSCSLSGPNCLLLNHFIEVCLTCKKLYISNVYNSISLRISIHHETVTANRAIDISITSLNFFSLSLLLLLLSFLLCVW